MGTIEESEGGLRRLHGAGAVPRIRIEDAGSRDLGRYDVERQEEDEGEDPELGFLTFAVPSNVKSFTQEIIATIIEVWDDTSETNVPIVYLSTLDGISMGYFDPRDSDDEERVVNIFVAEALARDLEEVE
jgi:hypothetical protein